MDSMKQRISRIREATADSYWKDRIVAEIDYLRGISEANADSFHSLIDEAIVAVENALNTDGAIGKTTALEVEDRLKPAEEAAKSYRLLCASHAHIDMNWMWGWQETVAVTLDTFKTILMLMEEYPGFTFAQSQASVYTIVEDYQPSMIDDIRRRVAEGRWEVTASQWVEGDKNIAGGESLMRHLLYTRSYLSDLLGIRKDQLNIDYEPDTFGHNANMPEILSQANVKYYYHCRGSNDRIAYRWFAPSGASVIAYQEPRWYNSKILPNLAEFVPGFCNEFKTNTALAVYGVGDHGGGPTRRDIERIIDMKTWPIYPEVGFGTYGDFFAGLETADLPEIRGERNFIFVGCYTSQTRIKMANRIAERTLNEAERLSAVSDARGLTSITSQTLRKPWTDTLFNHFHDILPGSGVTETREYALGKFQDTMASALSVKSQALQSIADGIDTGGYEADRRFDERSISEGAGVGFQSTAYEISRPERGRGDVRIFAVFNACTVERKDCVELTIWDWTFGEELSVCDADESPLPHQVIDSGLHHYWGHHYITVMIELAVPGMGYTTVCVRSAGDSSDSYLDNPLRTESNLVHTPVIPVLENDNLKVTFHPEELRIVSLIDKGSNEELIDGEDGGGYFRLLTEEGEKTWTAWVVGRIIEKQDLTSHAYLTDHNLSGDVAQWVEYRVTFASSEMKVRFQLNRGSKALAIHAKVAWREIGSMERGVPQLDFRCSHKIPADSYTYDIPFGTVTRDPSLQDRPAVSWAAAPQSRLQWVYREKNGFRADGGAMQLPLIRATTNPDPYPEVGDHDITFWIVCTDGVTKSDLIHSAEKLLSPFSAVSTQISKGNLPKTQGLFSVASDSVHLAAIKSSEDDTGLVIRLYESSGKASRCAITTAFTITNAQWVDADENVCRRDEQLDVKDGVLITTIPPYGTRSVKIDLS